MDFSSFISHNRAGLNIGDRIVSVNGETVSGRSYAQVFCNLIDIYCTIKVYFYKNKNNFRHFVVRNYYSVLKVSKFNSMEYS